MADVHRRCKQKVKATASPRSSGHTLPPVFLPLAIAVLVLSVGGYFLWRWLHPGEAGRLHVSGRIEGYEVNIGAKIGGRVDFIAVREGDTVTTGQPIVKISDDDIQAQLRGANARLQKAVDQREQAQDQIQVTKSQIDEANYNFHQARQDMLGRITQATEQVSASEAQLSQAEADLKQAQYDLSLAAIRKERYGKLVAKGAVMQDQYDQAATTYDTAAATVAARQAAVEAARKQLSAQKGFLTQARATRFNPPIRSAQVDALEKQEKLYEAQLRAAAKEIANAKAAVDEIKANISYLNINSPINGITTARAVEPGAVVVPGQTVLSLINLDTVYLRGYVPEGQIGRVRVGQKALVYLDSAPKKGIDGQVIEIDPVASFTPENIYFRDDRVKQVFGIKIGISHPGGFCKPGMPADADIVTE